MAGRVAAVVYWKHQYTDAVVTPDRCPAIEGKKDAGGPDAPQHGEKPRCYGVLENGMRQACPYFIAATCDSNTSVRVDVLQVARDGVDRGRASTHIGILCHRQKSNRPPGC